MGATAKRLQLKSLTIRCRFLYCDKCVPMQYACSKHLPNLLSSSLLSINARHCKTYPVKVWQVQSVVSFFVMFKCAPTQQTFIRHLSHSFVVLFIINKCAPLQNVSGQILVQSVIGFFIMFKCAQMQHACSTHLLHSFVVLFIINKCASLQNISGQNLKQSVVGFFIVF